MSVSNAVPFSKEWNLTMKEGTIFMGKIDVRTHEYLSDNKRFADTVNYCIYDGKQIIKPNVLIN